MPFEEFDNVTMPGREFGFSPLKSLKRAHPPDLCGRQPLTISPAERRTRKLSADTCRGHLMHLFGYFPGWSLQSVERKPMRSAMMRPSGSQAME
jgi:hypothetical protein